MAYGLIYHMGGHVKVTCKLRFSSYKEDVQVNPVLSNVLVVKTHNGIVYLLN